MAKVELGYEERDRRRVRRLVRRWGWVIVVGVVAVLAWCYWRPALEKWEMLRLQARCTRAVEKGTVVYDARDGKRTALLSKGGEYVADGSRGVYLMPTAWRDFKTSRFGGQMPFGSPQGILFSGMLRRPSGEERWVVVFVESRAGLSDHGDDVGGSVVFRYVSALVLEPETLSKQARVVWGAYAAVSFGVRHTGYWFESGSKVAGDDSSCEFELHDGTRVVTCRGSLIREGDMMRFEVWK